MYLDEVDKITAAQSHHHKDVSGRGVQTNLLKIMEETDIVIRPPWDIQSQMKQMMSGKPSDENETINTKNILFIMSGAFNGLPDVIKKRLQGATIGFDRDGQSNSEADTEHLLSQLRTQDLVSYGLEPEFAGRLPVHVTLNHLTSTDLHHILTSTEDSVLHHIEASFNHYGIEIAFTDEALVELSNRASEEAIGARALVGTFEKICRPFKFECPSIKVPFLLITTEVLMTSTAPLPPLSSRHQKLQNQPSTITLILNLKKPKLSHLTQLNY